MSVLTLPTTAPHSLQNNRTFSPLTSAMIQPQPSTPISACGTIGTSKKSCSTLVIVLKKIRNLSGSGQQCQI